MAQWRFLLLVLFSIAALACVTWLHLQIGTNAPPSRPASFILDDLGPPRSAVSPLPRRNDDRTAAARTRLVSRVGEFLADLDDSAAVARANFATGAMAQNLRGREDLLAGQFADAFDSYTRAEKSAPPGLDTLRGQAAALSRLQRMPEAIHLYDELIRREPRNATDRYNFAVCLARADRLSDAADQFHQALEIEPNFDRAVYNLAVICQQQGKLAEAVSLWQRFCDRQPAVASAWFNLGTAHSDLGHHAAALDAFQTASRLQPNDPISLYNIGMTLCALGRDSEAESPLAGAARLDPTDETTAAELRDLRKHLSPTPANQP